MNAAWAQSLLYCNPLEVANCFQAQLNHCTFVAAYISPWWSFLHTAQHREVVRSVTCTDESIATQEAGQLEHV